MDDEYRVAVCKYTKKQIVQIREGKDSWLCLHNETDREDQRDVQAFLAEQSKRLKTTNH